MCTCKKARESELAFVFYSSPLGAYLCASVSLRRHLLIISHPLSCIFIRTACWAGRKWNTFSALLAGFAKRQNAKDLSQIQQCTTCGIPGRCFKCCPQHLLLWHHVGCSACRTLLYGSLESASGCSSAHSRFYGCLFLCRNSSGPKLHGLLGARGLRKRHLARPVIIMTALYEQKIATSKAI